MNSTQIVWEIQLLTYKEIIEQNISWKKMMSSTYEPGITEHYLHMELEDLMFSHSLTRDLFEFT